MTESQHNQPDLNWREPIIRHFSPEIARSCRVTVAADPDGLLQDDLIATLLRGFGFDVVRFDDPVRFRFVYETQHRAKWDRGESTSVVVGAPVAETDLPRLPHDVLWNARQSARVLSFSFAQLFGNLAPDVLAELDKLDLDPLWVVRHSVVSNALGRNQTIDYVLRAVFKLSPEIATTNEELIAQLARLHLAGRKVPRSLAVRFDETARLTGRFAGWPFTELVASSEQFFVFIRERWECHLAATIPDQVTQPATLVVGGPGKIAFDMPDLRALVDNLFSEGRLAPVKVGDSQPFQSRWERCGIEPETAPVPAESTAGLLERISDEVPEPNVPPTVWTSFVVKWGELQRRYESLSPDQQAPINEQMMALRRDVDDRFLSWMRERFAGIVNRSILPIPTMVHQIPHFMAHRRASADRLALIVVDGMSFGQWLIVKDAPGSAWRQGLRVDEAAVFAWVPTLTSISRQSIFAGEPPLFFASTLLTTNAEDKHWKNFWEERGRRRDRIAMIKHGNDEPESAVIDRARSAIDGDGATIVAVVLNSIDRLVHGTSSTSSVLAASIRQWGADGHLVSLIQVLLGRGFDVFIAADHGNTEARGIGRPDTGDVPETAGSRAILFPDENTRALAVSKATRMLAWPNVVLPENTYAAIPKDRTAFIAPDGVVRSHGGATIDEVLVPFVRLTRA